jgi:hypothetical protein
MQHKAASFSFWVASLSLLLILLFLLLWSHYSSSSIEPIVLRIAPSGLIVAMFLLILSFALNGWKKPSLYRRNRTNKSAS